MPHKPRPEKGELEAIYENCTVQQTADFYRITKMTLNVWLREFGIKMKRAKPYKQSSDNGLALDGEVK